MIQNVISEIYFLKTLFRAYHFFIFVQMFQWTSSELLYNFRFSSRKSQIQQKLAKKITHNTIQFRSKNLANFTNLDSLDTENNMLLQYSQRPFWLSKVSSRLVYAWCQRKHLHCTISWRARTAFLKYFESKCLYFLYMSVRKIFPKDVVTFFLMRVVWGKAE